MALRRTSFREELSKIFEKKKKEELRADLQDVFLIVYLSFDLWTSRNRHAKTAIFRHYANKNQQQRNRPLALRHQSGAHGGENIANMLKRVIMSGGSIWSALSLYQILQRTTIQTWRLSSKC